jgi:hypothetical protein
VPALFIPGTHARVARPVWPLGLALSDWLSVRAAGSLAGGGGGGGEDGCQQHGQQEGGAGGSGGAGHGGGR